jgi:RNA polymerase sigma-70 factor (ECF subfamily)
MFLFKSLGGLMSTANLSDADLRRLLARAATGDVEAFLDFYDATCTVTWRLELCRHGDPAAAKVAATWRYVGAWLHAAEQAGSGLSARAWLLSLSPDLLPPVSRTDALPVGA